MNTNTFYQEEVIKMKNNKYKAAIIGCGRIGAFLGDPKNPKGVLTHAHAYKYSKQTNLVALVDINKNKASKAAKIWRTRFYTNISKMFLKEKPDIVSICVPDEFHEDVLKSCLKYKPKAVFCEKPLTTNIKSAKHLVKEYKKAKIFLAVNYTRRWNKTFINLRKKIKKNKYGCLLNAIGIYNKGILHTGSHLIDLLRFFFGEINQAVPLAARIDWKKTDPTLDVLLRLKNDAAAYLVGTDARQYEIFELDLLFEKGRIRLTETGVSIEYSKLINSPLVKGIKSVSVPQIKKTNLTSTLLKAPAAIIKALKNNEKLPCSGADILDTEEVCKKLIKAYKNKRKELRWKD
jgi:predicted dehydrogenase